MILFYNLKKHKFHFEDTPPHSRDFSRVRLHTAVMKLIYHIIYNKYYALFFL